jgi:hypothetical protein
MPNALRDIREGTRSEVEAWLQIASDEIAELDRRRAALLDDMDLARVWLGLNGRPTQSSDLSLQDAMVLVLREGANSGLRAPQLARMINERNLYRMRDGRSVDPHQIHARVHNYPQLFVRNAGVIRLRDEAEGEHE